MYFHGSWRCPGQLPHLPSPIATPFGITLILAALPYVRQTPVKPRPTSLHPPWRTQAPPAPPSRAPRIPAGSYRSFPPPPAIYSNRVGMNPDLPLTRLPIHNPLDCFHSVSALHATSLISYAT